MQRCRLYPDDQSNGSGKSTGNSVSGMVESGEALISKGGDHEKAGKSHIDNNSGRFLYWFDWDRGYIRHNHV